MAGAPAISPSTASRNRPGGCFANGVTIARPSVVLWMLHCQNKFVR